MFLDFNVESFNMYPLDGELINLVLCNVTSSRLALWDELCLIWEILCTEMVFTGDVPGFVV